MTCLINCKHRYKEKSLQKLSVYLILLRTCDTILIV
nr:MAG TPA: hypothetical protein [Caudoviricetes sp.]